MEKLIDSKDYYVESRKAIDIALAREDKFHKELSPEERLEVYKRHLKTTNNQEEYVTLKALKDALEMKIKFNDTTEPVVPKADQEKIRKNLEIEQRAAVEKTNELKTQLSELLDTFEKEAVPLIIAIEEMETLKVIPDKIDTILSHELREKHFLGGIKGRFNSLSIPIGELKRSPVLLNKSISYFRNTTVPVQEKKLKGGK